MWDVADTQGDGQRVGFFNEPHGVAALPWGEIAVSDTYNNRVQIFDQNGGLRAPELTPLRKRDINLSLSLYPPLRVFPIPLCVKFRSLSVQGHFACALAHRGESSCQFIPSLTGRLLLPRSLHVYDPGRVRRARCLLPRWFR